MSNTESWILRPDPRVCLPRTVHATHHPAAHGARENNAQRGRCIYAHGAPRTHVRTSNESDSEKHRAGAAVRTKLEMGSAGLVPPPLVALTVLLLLSGLQPCGLAVPPAGF